MINKTQLKPQIKISASLAYVDKKHHPAKRYSKRALRLQNGGIDTLHFDIKTKAGIENMGIGGEPTDDMFNADLIKRIRDDGFTPPIDVHLMDYEIPELEIDRLSDAGASAVYIHHHSFRETEAVVRALRYIRGKKLESGTVLSVGFGTEQLLSDMLDHSDLVALTAGREGWKGQKFNPIVINKVGELLSRNYRGVIQIQSGLNEQTISLAAGVGATKFVSGDYIMRFNSLEDGILRLRTAAEEGFGGA